MVRGGGTQLGRRDGNMGSARELPSAQRCVPRGSGRAPYAPTSPAGSPPLPRAASPAKERRGGGAWWWYAIGKKGRQHG